MVLTSARVLAGFRSRDRITLDRVVSVHVVLPQDWLATVSGSGGRHDGAWPRLVQDEALDRVELA